MLPSRYRPGWEENASFQTQAHCWSLNPQGSCTGNFTSEEAIKTSSEEGPWEGRTVSQTRKRALTRSWLTWNMKSSELWKKKKLLSLSHSVCDNRESEARECCSLGMTYITQGQKISSVAQGGLKHCCSPGWPQAHTIPPVSCQGLESQAWATMARFKNKKLTCLILLVGYNG